MSERPTPGRRRAVSATSSASVPTGRHGLLALVFVVLLGLAIWCAGTAPSASGLHGGARDTSALSKISSCVGGPAGAKAVIGRTTGAPTGISINGRPATKTSPIALTSKPVRVSADRTASPSSYAVASATGQGWLAATSCATPMPESWFVGAGAITTHHSVLTLANPRAGDAVVDLQVLGPKGQVQAPGLSGIRVPAGHSLHLQLQRLAPSTGDVAVHVVALRGLVAASVADQWSASTASPEIGEWVPSQAAAQKRLDLVGIGSGATKVTLLVANPAATDATVHLAFIGQGGTYAPTGKTSVNVPPGAVVPVDLTGQLKSAPLAVALQSQVPVSAVLRTVDRVDEAQVAPGASVGQGGVAALPQGTTGTLDLAAPAKGGSVSVTGYSPTGKVLGRRTVTLSSRSGAHVKLWPGTRAVSVSAPKHVVVLGTVLLQGAAGTVAAIPVQSTELSAHVPPVRPGW